MLFACLILLAAACAAAPVLTRVLGRNAGWILAVPLLLAVVLIFSATGWTFDTTVEEHVPWMPTLDIGLALRLDGLSLLFALLVLVIGAGVLAYASRYLSASGNHGTFYLLMTTFALAMLALVLTDDLVVLFVAWEATTLCSFFLIARSGTHAREPAIRTLLVTAAGGLSLLAAVAAIVVHTGTTRISTALADPVWGENTAFTVSVAVLLALAAFTKSAQFPFQAWLPDSMVAITPVSAYLHAAAMVKAGIYLLLRFSPALSEENIWNILLVTSGLLTAVFGATAALRRYDLKELLAYSTMSQLGLLVAMIGVGTPAALTAAVVHTVAHALFKSALFMFVGVIDHQAGTRDIRDLRTIRLRMPVTATAMTVAATSMAGIPLLLGFISKELMFTAFTEIPGGLWLSVTVTALAALTSVLTLAYSARLVLGAFLGRSSGSADIADSADSADTVGEASPAFLVVPCAAAVAGLVFGLVPALLDGLTGPASSASAGQQLDPHLEIWHGVNVALAVTVVVITAGILLVVWRDRVERFLTPYDLPLSGTAAVDALRSGTIRFGAAVGATTGSRRPALHLSIPIICLVILTVAGLALLRDLPAVVGEPSRTEDWLLVGLVGAGVVAALMARTRISAVVVVGVVGFSMTLWFFTLGAVDVALTQLLVEILTVCVMVLLLRRLPTTFRKASIRRRISAGVIAAAAGAVTVLGVLVFTGRREMSDAAEYYVREGYETTGGSNIVNTILVDFRALDTLGELTVLGIAGVAVAALLSSRAQLPVRSVALRDGSPLMDAAANSVFVRTATRLLGPVVVLVSFVLLVRGHYEPGGGFIAALVGGAGFALIYLGAASDEAAITRLRWPFMLLIGLGIAIGVGTGFLGYIEGSFLTPLHVDVFGYALSSALLFDVGVYLAVVGVVLAAFSELGREKSSTGHNEPSDVTPSGATKEASEL